MVQKNLNIAFVLKDANWYGGINYLKSLTDAILLLKRKNIKLYLYTPTSNEFNFLKNFDIPIIKSFFLNRSVINRIINKLSFFFFNKNIFVEYIFKKNKINILSHSNYSNLDNIKTVSWISDFQYLHYPKFFGKLIIDRNKKLHNYLIKNSHEVIISCKYSMKDFIKRYKPYKKKAHILRFVPSIVLPKNLLSFYSLKKKYNINEDFYFIPNQFWKHKNHECLFKALSHLNSKNISPNIVMAGKFQDYRNPKYIIKIRKFLDSKKIKNLVYLGELDYIEICTLLYNCKAVINPSFFEGWSTTVEESKLYDKVCILSNIPTHLEQNPKKGIFFDPKNFKQLSKIIENLEKKKIDRSIFNKKRYVNARKKFAREYLNIIQS